MRRHIDPERRSMPVEAWPAADRAAWARALEPADPLDDEVGYASSRWKPSTIQGIASGYGHWLTSLQHHDELDPATAHAWTQASRGKKFALDKDAMTETLLQYKGAEAGEVDWRPTETIPEDFYAM